MAVEIERKFLVTRTDMLDGIEGETLSQGYLSHSPDSTVRVRIAGQQGWLTIKGRTQGASRLEFEYSIPLPDAQQLLALCQSGRIEKTRYRIAVADLVWEVDVFHGDNHPLVVAEVELDDENQPVQLPDWAGREVTDDARYFNSALSETPFCRWPENCVTRN